MVGWSTSGSTSPKLSIKEKGVSMNENVKNAVLAWGGGFVTASTFGAVVPVSPHIGVPGGTPFKPCSIVQNIGAMEKTLNKVARKKGLVLSVEDDASERRQLVVERVLAVRKRLKSVENRENHVV